MTEFHPLGTGEVVEVSPSQHLKNIDEGEGGLLQLNRIGALTIITEFLGPGRFRTVVWDIRHPDGADRGWVIAKLETLEGAEGFHFALSWSLYQEDFGSAVREDAARFHEPSSLITATGDIP